MADVKPQEATSAIGAVETTDFDALLKKEFKPQTTAAQEAVQKAVRTLAAQALEQTQTQVVSDDVTKTIEAMIAELDKKLTEQVNLILHHNDFQALEGA